MILMCMGTISPPARWMKTSRVVVSLFGKKQRLTPGITFNVALIYPMESYVFRHRRHHSFISDGDERNLETTSVPSFGVETRVECECWTRSVFLLAWISSSTVPGRGLTKQWTSERHKWTQTGTKRRKEKRQRRLEKRCVCGEEESLPSILNAQWPDQS